MFWFHCGRCGSLFQSPTGNLEKRSCPECGADPCTGILEPVAEPAAPPAPAAGNPETPPGKTKKRAKRSGKKTTHRHFMLQLIAGWTLVLVLIVLGARKMWHVETPDRSPATATSRATSAPTAEDLILLKEAGQKCAEVFSGFLAAGTPEQQNQFVIDPIHTASRMARFYRLNSLANINPQTLSLAGNTVLALPGGKAIESQWNSEDGKKFDTVFLNENGEWRLDWDHFARYSDYPWALFLAGSGLPEGEFRLLARERLAEERKNSETISLVLYAPRFGHPAETGFQSPEFLVSRNSREGQLLDAAFKRARAGKPIYDSKLPNLNPDGMIRVRVKIKRTEENLGRKFEITGVIACHWYSVNDPGVEPVEPAAPAEPLPQDR